MAQVAQARTEESGLSQFVPIGSLIGLILAALGVKVLIDPHGGSEYPCHDLRPARQRRGRRGSCATGRAISSISKLLLAAIALFVGVGGIWLLFTGVSTLVERFPPKVRDRILPWVFVAPALVLLSIYLVYPAVATIIGSFLDKKGAFTLDNWASLGTGPFLEILRNNAIWLLVATSGSVGLGLLTAALFDRIRRESLAKIFIFTPLAISLVGAIRHLEVRLRLAATQPAAVRAPERDLDVTRQRARPWATTFPINLPAEMLDHDLAPDGLRHGRASRPRSRAYRSRSWRPRASTAPASARSSSG